MNPEQFLERLCGVRRSGAGWLALCPAHGDKNPSLAIDVRDGKILLHDHAGCAPQAVCAALGIEMRELFNDSAPAPRIEAVYAYLGEDGRVLFKVVRYVPRLSGNGGRTETAAGRGI